MTTPSPPPSDSERLSLSRSILLSSPPGQFDLLLADLRSANGSSGRREDDPLSDDWAQSVRAEYESQSGRDVLSSDDAGSGGGRPDDTDLAKEVRRAMDAHMRLHYGSYGGGQKGRDFSNQAQFLVKSDPSSGGGGGGEVIKVRTYAERVDLRNYHAGSFGAEYTVRTSDSNPSGEATLEGEVRLRAHSFEDGNVQLTSVIALGPAAAAAAAGSGSSSDPPAAAAALADAIAAQIRLWEDDDVQSKLGEMYDSVNGGMLKSLRRVMPVTRTKMDWTVEGHRIARTFQGRKEG